MLNKEDVNRTYHQIANICSNMIRWRSCSDNLETQKPSVRKHSHDAAC